MALTPYLSPLTFPAGTEIPGTMQGLANLLAQYFAFRFDSPQTKLDTHRLRPNGYSITIS